MQFPKLRSEFKDVKKTGDLDGHWPLATEGSFEYWVWQTGTDLFNRGNQLATSEPPLTVCIIATHPVHNIWQILLIHIVICNISSFQNKWSFQNKFSCLEDGGFPNDCCFFRTMYSFPPKLILEISTISRSVLALIQYPWSWRALWLSSVCLVRGIGGGGNPRKQKALPSKEGKKGNC